MNRLTIYILAILTLGIASCESDLREEDYLFNYFFDDQGNKSIVIDSVSIIKYDVHPTTHDTSLVKFLVNYRLSEKVFSDNNIFTPKFNFTAELYINDIEYPVLMESGTNKINIYRGFNLFKNKTNKMYFKYIFWDSNERVVSSDTLNFRVN